MHQEVRTTKKGAGTGNKGSRNEIDHAFFATSSGVCGQRFLPILVNQNSGDTSNASGFNTK